MAGKALDVDLEQVELSEPAVAALLSGLVADFDSALANHIHLDGQVTVGTLAWLLVDSLTETLEEVEPDSQRRALMLREMAGCLLHLGAKHLGQKERMH